MSNTKLETVSEIIFSFLNFLVKFILKVSLNAVGIYFSLKIMAEGVNLAMINSAFLRVFQTLKEQLLLSYVFPVGSNVSQSSFNDSKYMIFFEALNISVKKF